MSGKDDEINRTEFVYFKKENECTLRMVKKLAEGKYTFSKIRMYIIIRRLRKVLKKYDILLEKEENKNNKQLIHERDVLANSLDLLRDTYQNNMKWFGNTRVRCLSLCLFPRRCSCTCECS